MDRNKLPFNCRQCPSSEFELCRIAQPNFGPTRKMAICHAKEVILQPLFPENNIKESLTINKANERTVRFDPVENCPHVENLISEGMIPWETASIDFSARHYEYKAKIL